MYRTHRVVLVPFLLVPMVGCVAMPGNKPVLPSAAIKEHDLSDGGASTSRRRTLSAALKEHDRAEASEDGSTEKKSDSPTLVRTWLGFAGLDKEPSVLKNSADAKGNGEKNGDKKEEGPKHIRDNAIFVEEAFNQEPGDAQHIFVWQHFWDKNGATRSRDFAFAYTLELPIGSQKHQFSFTTQFLTGYEAEDLAPANQFGDVGDTFLNYRYQLLDNDDFLWCSPRFSVILPTGDKRLGAGTGEVGYQFNLPVSRYGEQFDFHLNLGYTHTPGVSVPTVTATPFEVLSPRQDLRAYNLGVSSFWKPKEDFHLFVEALAVWGDEIDDFGARRSTTQVLVNPGLRFAIIQDPLEWVLGFSVPIGLTRDTPDIGFIAYMSIEHPFRKQKNGNGD